MHSTVQCGKVSVLLTTSRFKLCGSSLTKTPFSNLCTRLLRSLHQSIGRLDNSTFRGCTLFFFLSLCVLLAWSVCYLVRLCLFLSQTKRICFSALSLQHVWVPECAYPHGCTFNSGTVGGLPQAPCVHPKQTLEAPGLLSKAFYNHHGVDPIQAASSYHRVGNAPFSVCWKQHKQPLNRHESQSSHTSEMKKGGYYHKVVFLFVLRNRCTWSGGSISRPTTWCVLRGEFHILNPGI